MPNVCRLLAHPYSIRTTVDVGPFTGGAELHTELVAVVEVRLKEPSVLKDVRCAVDSFKKIVDVDSLESQPQLARIRRAGRAVRCT